MTAEPSARPPAPGGPRGERARASLAIPVLACVAIAALGAWLRLDQFTRQVLLDDEWHVVHQLLWRGPAQFVLDLGHADYGIPIALYDWVLVHSIGLSETAMRLPMMLAGLATIALLPLAVAARIGRAPALAFALLLALSPPLVAYSQMARPYAFDLLLGWVAHWAFHRWWKGARTVDGAVYAIAASFACWMHLIVAPFVLAPFAWAAWKLMSSRGLRRTHLRRAIALGAAVAVALALLLGPPLVLRPEALGEKSGFRAFDAETVARAVYWWFGTRSTTALILALVLAAIGAPRIWRALPEARTGVLGVLATAAGLAIARPEWGFTTLAFGRYLLPIVPLLLCAVACGAMTAGAALAGHGRRSALASGVVVALAAGALAASSPLREWTRVPTSHRLGIVHLFEFREGRNAAREAQSMIPMSPFWATLSKAPPDSLLVAAAPFRFESYDWDGTRWERKSRQRVIPGWLTGLCVAGRPGEIPAGGGYAFENGVHLADREALRRRGVDYVVWQKPWTAPADDRLERSGDHVAACPSVLRERFGPPAYEDAQLIAFRLAPGPPVARP